ncbi:MULTISPECIES: murein biosynthesis integral membrane protein MurJ [unclassified Beijerinckia]|uniref:murein biosynthesis integral membrane protein MurJ n=1 Tax=unclassified Beijerinckia TaxID=2638183 RepID=UPI00089842AB|nr:MULTISPECIES: murein biosynthesis integral membrane protein MurJ [unclassified Beijerinckia]MDH7796482.1 putative peptidoglycan lipid II flippase [Beijerinckia sp. GAS462]SEC47014.1 putative peptidoglycan lipid II flippase [Beijerinckia sp. 28-YEA-48]
MSGLARNLLSVGGFTLLSRVTGFVRDIALGAFLGAGALADAFYIALRLPNHFRAIFGEGAFNAAYVPGYSRALEERGKDAARLFSARMFTLLFAVQIILLLLAWAFMPQVMAVLAPGLEADPTRLALAETMTRITFPYLLCVTLVTLVAGTLNANGRFAAAAFAPVLLNLAILAFLAIAFLFPNAGYAAAAGVLVAGALELMLVLYAARRAGILAVFARPRWDADVKRFFKTFVPAVIGSAGVQIALFADTIIVSMLPTGGVSSVYYADRIYQLPGGVIAIAAGTVLLPEMSRRFAAGDNQSAYAAQNRTMAVTAALSAPFFVAFIMISDIIMRGVFLRGAFDETAASAAAHVLMAYGWGLPAAVLVRSAVASFQARGDTTTPMIISLLAVAVNVGLKILLFRPYGAAGLAIATSVGTWINLLLLVGLAVKRGSMQPDATTGRIFAAVVAATLVLAVVAFAAQPLADALAVHAGRWSNETRLVTMGICGALAYGIALAGALYAFGVRPGRLRPLRQTQADKAATPEV